MVKIPKIKCSFCSCALVLALAAIGIIFWSFYKQIRANVSWSQIWNALMDRGKITVEEQAKEKLKKQGKNLENEIYKQATEHNPTGDLLPDSVDDTIKAKLKEEAKKKIE